MRRKTSEVIRCRRESKVKNIMFEKNPFDPHFGSVPCLCLDLDKDIKKYAQRAHRSGNHPVYCLFITGVYGSGKTVFMKLLGQELKKQSNTIVVTLQNTRDLFKTMYNKLASLLPNLKIADSVERHKEIYYGYKLDQILTSIKKKNCHVVFCLDDIANTPAIRNLAENLNDWSLNNFQISVIMAGLPQEVAALSMTDNLTFLMRSDRFNVPKLQESSVAQAYQKVFTFQNSNLTKKMADLTQGYPYAFQLLGDQMYKSLRDGSEPGQAFEKAKLAFKDLLFKQAYNVIAYGLRKEELSFLFAMAQHNSLGFIIEQLKQKKQVVNSYRIKLTKDGLIKPLTNRNLTFSLPLFKEFMLARYKELQ